MKLRGVALALTLCALPTHGNGGEGGPPPEIVHLLTPIDCTPTLQELTARLGPSSEGALARLREYALDPSPTADFGMRLRAVRSIPYFCGSHPDECRSALYEVFAQIAGTADSGKKILRYRAAIEALGGVRSSEPAVDLATLLPFIEHPSRDLRVSAARALRDLCNADAKGPLNSRRDRELVLQVRYAIDNALEVLENCGSR